MLVSTQLFIAPIAKSDPSIHTGDAYVGEVWVSELDVSTVLTEFNDITLAHARADHDWVAWEEGTGNITVNWTIDIDSTNHPQYYIQYSLVVYNVEEDIVELGNATYAVTINADATSDTSGSLTIPIQFSSGDMQKWSDVTLVCLVGAFVQANGNEDAKDFSHSAGDRSVLAVDWEIPLLSPTFGVYVDEANENCPSMWSYLEGWENHFATEDDMLNEQTVFIVGCGMPDYTEPYRVWRMGTMKVVIGPNGVLRCDQTRWTTSGQGETTAVSWLANNDYINGSASLGYNVIQLDDDDKDKLFLRAFVTSKEARMETGRGGIDLTMDGEDQSGRFSFKVKFRPSVHDTDNPQDGIIDVGGFMFAHKRAVYSMVQFNTKGYQLTYDENPDQQGTISQQSITLWEDDCAYTNFTGQTLSVSSSTDLGITTVDVDITNALQNGGQPVISFAADRGETRVEFVC